MSKLFSSTGIYPDKKFNVDSLHIQKYYEIPPEVANNPYKICTNIYGSMECADILWLVNHIHNPFKELKAGKVLACPSMEQINSATTATRGTSTSVTTKVKNVKRNGNTLTY